MLPKDYLARCSHIAIGGYIVEARTKTPIDKESALKGLAGVQRLIPELTKSDATDDDYYLTTTDSRSEISGFRMENFDSIAYFWAENASAKLGRGNFDFFDRLVSEFGLYKPNIDQLTQSFLFFSYDSVNHFDVIKDALFSNSPLGKLFPLGKIIDNDLSIIGRIDGPFSASVSIQSDVTADQVTKHNFEDSLLQVRVQVAREGPLPGDMLFAGLLTEQLAICDQFLNSAVVPNVLEALDRAISELQKRR